MAGWISIDRQITSNWLWEDKPFSKGQAWIDILLRINHKSGKATISGQLIDVAKGQTLWSVKDMAERWGWSRKKTSSFLNILERDGMITQKRTSKYTLLTVVNWGYYQTENMNRNIKRTSKEHQKNTNNNDNNETIKDIVYFLNQVSGKKFTTNASKTKTCINARIAEGYSIDDFKQVILTKVNQWKDDNYYCKYIRPETLFGTKFEGYLNERPKIDAEKIEQYEEVDVSLDELFKGLN